MRGVPGVYGRSLSGVERCIRGESRVYRECVRGVAGVYVCCIRGVCRVREGARRPVSS